MMSYESRFGKYPLCISLQAYLNILNILIIIISPELHHSSVLIGLSNREQRWNFNADVIH